MDIHEVSGILLEVLHEEILGIVEFHEVGTTLLCVPLMPLAKTIKEFVGFILKGVFIMCTRGVLGEYSMSVHIIKVT